MTLASPVELLNEAASRAPERAAFVCGGCSVSYAQALSVSAALSADLRRRGAKGRTVALVLPNGIEICLYAFAVQAAGGMLCTVNPGYTARELSVVLSDAEPAVVVCTPEGEAAIRASVTDGDQVDVVVLPPDTASWLAAWTSEELLQVPDPGSIATLQYTGGTSGRPKGVLLSHAAVARNIEQREAMLPTAKGDERVLCVMPLFHVFAQSMALHLSVMAQGTLYILPRYRPDWTLDALEGHAITRFPAGPTVFNGLVGYQGFSERDWSHLRCAYSGSAPLSVATLRRWEAITEAPIYEGYGQTEAGPILTFNGPRMPVRAGTVGKPVEGTQIRIVDLGDPSRAVPPGEVGEVVARGPQIMLGYKGLPEENAETLKDGWLFTGDVGRFDEAGYLVIEDRRKDMVLVSGYNVYPREVDELLMAHPDIAEAAVIGVPDEYRGERLVAYVALREGRRQDAGTLAAYCQEGLVRYKVPSEFVFEAALPRTAAQKIDKKALRDRVRTNVA